MNHVRKLLEDERLVVVDVAACDTPYPLLVVTIVRCSSGTSGENLELRIAEPTLSWVPPDPIIPLTCFEMLDLRTHSREINDF